jgi:hypothetical protein
MRKLLANTAAAGAALHMAGCDRNWPPVVCDPLPPPFDSNSPVVCDPLPPPFDSNSPVVCDPLPPPMDCNDLTRESLDWWIGKSARWVDADGQPAIRVDLSSVAPGLTFAGPPVLEGAALSQADVETTSLTFACRPTAGTTSVEVAVPVRCEDVGGTIHLALDVSGTSTVGATVPITVGP